VLVEPIVLQELRYEVGYLNVVFLHHHDVTIAEDTQIGEYDELGISPVVVRRRTAAVQLRGSTLDTGRQ
jgi:hypothetical protein